jgi:hypothetical protein
MNIITSKELHDMQSAFFAKHRISKVITSPMEGNGYHKAYLAEDGAEMWESNQVVTESATVVIRGVEVPVTAKLFRIECWSTDNASSVFVYERA